MRPITNSTAMVAKTNASIITMIFFRIFRIKKYLEISINKWVTQFYNNFIICDRGNSKQ